MEKVKTLYVYNLLNSNGDELRMRLGYVIDANGNPCNGNAGWRWSFDGKHIPMPVRSRTWFCGFPEQTMISWLKGNGWYVRTRVDVMSGYADVYELPKGNEESKSDVTNLFYAALRRLCNEGKKMTAASLYEFVYECPYIEAYKALTEIVDQQE